MLQEIGSSMCAVFENSQSLVMTPLLVMQVHVSLMVPLKVKSRMSDKKSPVASTLVSTLLLISQLQPVTWICSPNIVVFFERMASVGMMFVVDPH